MPLPDQFEASLRSCVRQELVYLWESAQGQGNGEGIFLAMGVIDAQMVTFRAPRGTPSATDWGKEPYAIIVQWRRSKDSPWRPGLVHNIIPSLEAPIPLCRVATVRSD